MKAGVLYSGGKDSSLMAVILKDLGYDVELVTVNFGVFDSFKPAVESALSLGFSHRILKCSDELLHQAVEMILDDGYPNKGITYLHNQVLHQTASSYPLIADGIRRDDKVPKLDINQIRSLEDSKKVEYLNLSGFGYKTIDALTKKFFMVSRELTTMNNNSDYEIEIRYLIDELRGDGTSSSIFPEHMQTRVTGWRENE